MRRSRERGLVAAAADTLKKNLTTQMKEEKKEKKEKIFLTL